MIKVRPISITERALLLALVEFAPCIQPSVATLGQMLGSDARVVRRLLRSCEAKGLLRVVPRSSGKGHLANHYELLCDPQLAAPESEVRTQSPEGTDVESGGVRTQGPPKQTIQAANEAAAETSKHDGLYMAALNAVPEAMGRPRKTAAGCRR